MPTNEKSECKCPCHTQGINCTGKDPMMGLVKCHCHYNKEYRCELCRPLPDPIEAILFRMEQQGLTQADLVKAGCGQRSHVSEILNRKRKLNLRFIRAYHRIADTTPLKVLIQDYSLTNLK